MTATDAPQDVPPPTPPTDPNQPPVDPADQLELKLPGEATTWRDLGLWAGALLLLSLVTFWPAVDGRFQWRDDRAVSNNRALALPGGLSYVWADRWTDAGTYPYRPYAPVAFTADWAAYRLGGHDASGAPTPTAYHVVSVVAHALAAVLVWLALRELAVPAAWLVAAVFALHPVNAEAVSWVSDGGVPIAGLLFWAAIYCYLLYQTFRDRDAADRAAGGPGGDPAQTWGLYAGFALAATLAALAWPAAGACGGVLLLALWWRRRLTSFDGLLVAPVLAVGAFLWLANLALSREPGPGGAVATADLGFGRVVAMVGESVGFAVGKLLVPVRLSLIYPPSVVGGAVALFVAAGAVAVTVIAAVRGGPRWPAAAVGAVVLCTVPALNWVDPGRHSQQVDPLAYLATVPVAAVVVAAVTAAARRVRPAVLDHVQSVVVASAAVLLVLGVLAWRRAGVFATPVTLWRATADRLPDSPFAAAQYAEQLRVQASDDAANDNLDAAKAGIASAIAESDRAVRLAGGDPVVAAPAQRTWATALVARGDAAQALPHYAQATRPDAGPPDAHTLVDYGQALYELGTDLPGAVRQLNLSLATDPSSARAHRVLGQAYTKLGNPDRGLLEHRKAVAYDPTDPAAQQLLAEALVARGQLADAMQHYITLLTDPVNQARPDLWAAVARLKAKQGDYFKAVDFFRRAKTLDPTVKVDADLAAAEKELNRQAATNPAVTQPTTVPTTQGS